MDEDIVEYRRRMAAKARGEPYPPPRSSETNPSPPPPPMATSPQPPSPPPPPATQPAEPRYNTSDADLEYARRLQEEEYARANAARNANTNQPATTSQRPTGGRTYDFTQANRDAAIKQAQASALAESPPVRRSDNQPNRRDDEERKSLIASSDNAARPPDVYDQQMNEYVERRRRERQERREEPSMLDQMDCCKGCCDCQEVKVWCQEECDQDAKMYSAICCALCACIVFLFVVSM